MWGCKGEGKGVTALFYPQEDERGRDLLPSTGRLSVKSLVAEGDGYLSRICDSVARLQGDIDLLSRGCHRGLRSALDRVSKVAPHPLCHQRSLRQTFGSKLGPASHSWG